MRKTFDEQLELLSQELTHMGALCETAIASATEALKNRDVDLAKHAIAADQEIDQQEREIERLCLKLLLQQQPVARDLRQISSALKMITDMERIGDQAADISEIVTYMSEENLIQELDRIDAMARAASQMVTQSVGADPYDCRRSQLRRAGPGLLDDRQVSRAHRRPCHQYCRVGGVLDSGTASGAGRNRGHRESAGAQRTVKQRFWGTAQAVPLFFFGHFRTLQG